MHRPEYLHSNGYWCDTCEDTKEIEGDFEQYKDFIRNHWWWFKSRRKEHKAVRDYWASMLKVPCPDCHDDDNDLHEIREIK